MVHIRNAEYLACKPVVTHYSPLLGWSPPEEIKNLGLEKARYRKLQSCMIPYIKTWQTSKNYRNGRTDQEQCSPKLEEVVSLKKVDIPLKREPERSI